MSVLAAYRYRGQHRAPTTTAETAGRLAIAGAVGLLPLAFTPAAAADEPPGGWDPIIACESGNRNVANATGASSAQGYLQITRGTWASHGGLEFAPTAMGATRAEQITVANRIFTARGSLADWAASRGCWGSKVAHRAPAAHPRPAKAAAAPTPAPVRPRAARAAPTHPVTPPPARPRHRPAQAAPSRTVYTVRPGDNLSMIAFRHGHRDWHALWHANQSKIHNPDLIFPGTDLHLA